MPAEGGPPGLARAGVGRVPTHPFPQVKSWLRRPKLDDSEENAVGSPLCLVPHSADLEEEHILVAPVPKVPD